MWRGKMFDLQGGKKNSFQKIQCEEKRLNFTFSGTIVLQPEPVFLPSCSPGAVLQEQAEVTCIPSKVLFLMGKGELL